MNRHSDERMGKHLVQWLKQHSGGQCPVIRVPESCVGPKLPIPASCLRCGEAKVMVPDIVVENWIEFLVLGFNPTQGHVSRHLGSDSCMKVVHLSISQMNSKTRNREGDWLAPKEIQI